MRVKNDMKWSIYCLRKTFLGQFQNADVSCSKLVRLKMSNTREFLFVKLVYALYIEASP